MSIDPWRPFGQEDDPEQLYTALHEGVPEWMQNSLNHWVRIMLQLFLFRDENKAYGRLRQIERDLRTPIKMPNYTDAEIMAAATLDHFSSEQDMLELTDYLLSTFDVEQAAGWQALGVDAEGNGIVLQHLEEVLKESGSKWTIGFRMASRFGLVQRVPEGVQDAADNAMRTSAIAGKTLAKAWGEVFGINPNPREAYRLAVESVEDASIPALGLNKSKTTTLSTVIRKINGNDYSASDWALPFQREDEHYSNGQTVVAMLKTLWAGQVDRHGGNHEFETKQEISQEAAEAAVMLAVPLVQWFSSGAVARR